MSLLLTDRKTGRILRSTQGDDPIVFGRVGKDMAVVSVSPASGGVDVNEVDIGRTRPHKWNGRAVVPMDASEVRRERFVEMVRAKIQEVDRNSADLIDEGADFGDIPLSLSLAAQHNLNVLLQEYRAGELKLPVAISRRDGYEFVIRDPETLMKVKTLLIGTVKSILDKGRALRQRLLNVRTLEDFAVIVDDRTFENTRLPIS